jgi:hypothetical protein
MPRSKITLAEFLTLCILAMLTGFLLHALMHGATDESRLHHVSEDELASMVQPGNENPYLNVFKIVK